MIRVLAAFVYMIDASPSMVHVYISCRLMSLSEDIPIAGGSGQSGQSDPF